MTLWFGKVTLAWIIFYQKFHQKLPNTNQKTKLYIKWNPNSQKDATVSVNSFFFLHSFLSLTLTLHYSTSIHTVSSPPPGVSPFRFFLSSCVRGGKVSSWVLRALMVFQLKIICLPKWSILGQPAHIPYRMLPIKPVVNVWHQEMAEWVCLPLFFRFH